MLTQKKIPSQRLVTLDYLRGIAALAVMCLHMTEQIGATHQYPGKLFSYGYLGVDLFFVISGFVIFYTLNSKSSPGKFIIARFSRLFPTYWFAVSFAMLMALVVTWMGWAKPEHDLTDYLFNLTMLQSFFNVKDIDVVYWTLTIELVFYVAIGLIFFLTRKDTHRYLLLIAFMMLCLVYKVDREFAFLPEEALMKKYLIINQIPYFIAGIGLYVLRSSRKWGLLLLIPAVILVNLTQWRKDLGFSEILVIKNMIFILAFLATWFPVPNWKGAGHTLLSFFGRISYPLYLLHSEFSWYFLHELRPIQNTPLALLVNISIILTLSWLVHRYIETRLSDALKKRLMKMWNKTRNIKINMPETGPIPGITAEKRLPDRSNKFHYFTQAALERDP